MNHPKKTTVTHWQRMTETSTGRIIVRRVTLDGPNFLAEKIVVDPYLDRSRVVESQGFSSLDRAVSYCRFGMVY